MQDPRTRGRARQTLARCRAFRRIAPAAESASSQVCYTARSGKAACRILRPSTRPCRCASAEISVEPQFQEIARALKANPDITITIESHTDRIGTDTYNQRLSECRAIAVKQKLVADYGIAPARLDSKGFGEARPKADNSTAAGLQANRRVMAVIMRSRFVTE